MKKNVFGKMKIVAVAMGLSVMLAFSSFAETTDSEATAIESAVESEGSDVSADNNSSASENNGSESEDSNESETSKSSDSENTAEAEDGSVETSEEASVDSSEVAADVEDDEKAETGADAVTDNTETVETGKAIDESEDDNEAIIESESDRKVEAVVEPEGEGNEEQKVGDDATEVPAAPIARGTPSYSVDSREKDDSTVTTMMWITPAYTADTRNQMIQEVYNGVTASDRGSYKTQNKYPVDEFGAWTRALETRFYSARPADMAIAGASDTGYRVLVALPGVSMEDVRRKDSVYEAEVARLVAATAGMTAERKVRFFHDYIIKKCEYDTTCTKSRAYDCLIDGSSICNGYAIAFYNLCDAAGLKVEYIVGHANNGKSSVLHAWNSVTVNGQKLYYDLTWDDCSGKDKFYAMSESDFAKNHSLEQVVANN